MFAFCISILVRTTFYTYIFQFFTDIEAAFDLASFYYVFQCSTHNCVTFSRFYVKKVYTEIEFTVQTYTSPFFNVL